MSTASNKPGVMLYFENLPALDALTPHDAGRLLLAVMHYGCDGTVPDFSDALHLDLLWKMFRPRVDFDSEKYARICENRRIAANFRWEREKEMQVDALDAKRT